MTEKSSLMSTSSQLNCPTHQRGTALVIAMVLIFIMTVLGMTAMRESSLEKRMTTNSVHKFAAFQAAESATELTINDHDNLNAAFASPGIVTEANIAQPSNAEVLVTSSIVYTGNGLPVGFSLGGGISALRYRVEGQADIENVQSSSRVNQGLRRLVPSL